ncbi:Glyoxalase-like domain protein [Pigmentiphaga humi]|uniref:Glyoxalase-like domain protein n=1 Tax=Pigmentiphaga humi TaxID=2478468 RepID=A0A3P4B2B8_9BURK|nr:VOC family protein [Pigmentiphaga humi]VCU70423.1 Glyoxalase-like domain protein [Pigmentiphaga humi]
MSNRPHSIHHINFPCTDVNRTREWYTKVFGMKHVDVGHLSNTKVLLLTRGDFDLHFTPMTEMRNLFPVHWAMEVEDWDGFLAHLRSIGVRYTKPVERPQNNSKFCYIHDPDGTTIELTYHGNRPG